MTDITRFKIIDTPVTCKQLKESENLFKLAQPSFKPIFTTKNANEIALPGVYNN